MRRVLEYSSSEDDANSITNITVTREYPFDTRDYLIALNIINVGPMDHGREMTNSPIDATVNVSRDEVDNEIRQLRNSIKQDDVFNETHQDRRIGLPIIRL